jgi:cytochrome c6
MNGVCWNFGVSLQTNFALALFTSIYQAAKGFGVAGALAFGMAVPAFAADVAAGEQVFNANCAACHAGGQNVIMPDKTLEKEALDQYLAGGRSVASVVTQVTNGKNAMPAFGGRLSDEDIANVATYVITTADAGWE